MEVGEAEAGKQLPFQPRERAAVQGAGSGGHKDLGFISATAATDGGKASLLAGT